jgi:hypothetical protein
MLVLLLLPGCYRGPAPDDTVADSGHDTVGQVDHGQAASGPDSASSEARSNSTGDPDATIEVNGLRLSVPREWEKKPPASQLVAAEYVLPGAEGDDADGRLTISTAGGSVEANIERWKGQFIPEPQAESQEEIEVAGLKVTVVDLSGDFNDQRGPFAPGEKRPGYRMIAAVIPSEGQSHFIKATGPQKTIEKHNESILGFIRSVQPAK